MCVYVCVCWCLCVFEGSSHRGLLQPGCQKNGISLPWGAKHGVQTQGTQQVLGAGTQRAQKHTHTHTLTHRLIAGLRGYVCSRAPRSVKYTPSGITRDMFTGLLWQCAGLCQKKPLKGRSWRSLSADVSTCVASHHVRDPGQAAPRQPPGPGMCGHSGVRDRSPEGGG